MSHINLKTDRCALLVISARSTSLFPTVIGYTRMCSLHWPYGRHQPYIIYLVML